jgi:hypothetical protein
VLKAFSQEAAFEGARAISRITGCSLGTAGALFGELPAVLPRVLFRHQAQRLARELATIGVNAEVLPAQPAHAGEREPSCD